MEKVGVIKKNGKPLFEVTAIIDTEKNEISGFKEKFCICGQQGFRTRIAHSLISNSEAWQATRSELRLSSFAPNQQGSLHEEIYTRRFPSLKKELEKDLCHEEGAKYLLVCDEGSGVVQTKEFDLSSEDFLMLVTGDLEASIKLYFKELAEGLIKTYSDRALKSASFEKS